MKRPTELIEKAKGFKSTDPIRVLTEYAVSLESPHKTVSDAVDYFDGVWPDSGHDCLYTTGPEWIGGLEYVGTYRPADRKGVNLHLEDELEIGCDAWALVCTREEFEAEVERRKGDIATGEMPKLIEGDQLDNTGIWFKGAAWYLDGPDALQQCHSSTLDSVCLIRRAGKVIWKRKSSISKAEAWDKLVKEMEDPKGKFAFSAFYDILEQFEVK